MSISINAVIRKDKINTNLCAPINIRLTLKSKSRYIGTNVTIPLEAWDSETQQVNLNYPNAAELQYKINSTFVTKINHLTILHCNSLLQEVYLKSFNTFAAFLTRKVYKLFSLIESDSSIYTIRE